MLSFLVGSAALFATVSAGVLQQRSTTPCYTTHTGVLRSALEPMGLNSNNIMIYPAGSVLLNVELQVQ